MNMDGIAVVENHKVASHEEWIAARRAFLAKEKELTRLRDELNEQRRALPWERVTRSHLLGTTDGPRTLEQLFADRSQLVVYHAMFHPHKATPRTPWTQDAACAMCSFWMDNFNGITAHLNHRDVTIIAASKAPVDKLAAYRARMGWSFQWVSTAESDFNADYGVPFTDEEVAKLSGTYNYKQGGHYPIVEHPGISVFYRNPSGEIFHTYSTYGRGLTCSMSLITTSISFPRVAMRAMATAPAGCAGTTNTTLRDSDPRTRAIQVGANRTKASST